MTAQKTAAKGTTGFPVLFVFALFWSYDLCTLNVRCVPKTFDILVACYLYVHTLGIHSINEVREKLEKNIKDPCSPKRLCALVLLFWPGSFIECSVLIGCYFPSGNFQLREIPAMHSG